MVILSTNEEILPQDLPKEIIQKTEKDFSSFSDELKSLDEIESDYILHILQKTGGNRGETAEILGIDVKTLYRKLKNSGRA